LAAPDPQYRSWRCAVHGDVLPLRFYDRLDPADLELANATADVPLWLPDPLPAGWWLAGLAIVCDENSRGRATVTALRGPAPLGGEGQWLIVAEEPAIGLGASYALAEESTAPSATSAVPAAKIHAYGHPTPLWPVPTHSTDRSAYVGEAAGVWLWLISMPADAGYAVLDDLSLADARLASELDVPVSEEPAQIRPDGWGDSGTQDSGG
jgi:hypothetical protein